MSESNTFTPLKHLCYLTYYNIQSESKDSSSYEVDRSYTRLDNHIVFHCSCLHWPPHKIYLDIRSGPYWVYSFFSTGKRCSYLLLKISQICLRE